MEQARYRLQRLNDLIVINDELMPETFSATKKIGFEELPKVRERVKRLNKRAEYLDCPALTLTHEESINPAGYKWCAVTISGKAPRLPCGWYLLAYAYTLAGYYGQMILIIPGRMAVPDEHNMMKIWRCDYCRGGKPHLPDWHDREKFVFGNSGQEFVVGSCCIDDLSDLIGYQSPAALVWTAEMIHFLNLRRFEEVGLGSHFFGDEIVPNFLFPHRELVSFLDIEDAVAAAACSIRHFGWSATLLSGPESEVGSRVKDIRKGSMTKNGKPVAVEDIDVAVARDAIIWAREQIPSNTDDDDLNKVRTLARFNWVFGSDLGLAGLLIARYQETKGLSPTGDIRSDPSRHVGVIKQRCDLIATVTQIFDMVTEEHYGTATETKHIHLFRDPAGNVLKWTTYSRPPVGAIKQLFWRSPRLVEGQVYELRDATIVVHEDWRGVRQTVIGGRCTPILRR